MLQPDAIGRHHRAKPDSSVQHQYLRGDISPKYSKDAFGEIDIIQDIKKFPGGGEIWRGREWPTIVDEEKVTLMNIFSMDKDGNILETMTMAPGSDAANGLFKGRGN